MTNAKWKCQTKCFWHSSLVIWHCLALALEALCAIALPFVLLALLSVTAHAQVIWQPTPAPLVTAENTTWFAKGEPVQWNGDLYYPDGVPQFFNPLQMVRTGYLEASRSTSTRCSSPTVPCSCRCPAGACSLTNVRPCRRMAPCQPGQDAGRTRRCPRRRLPRPMQLSPPAPGPVAIGTSGRTTATPEWLARAAARARPRPFRWSRRCGSRAGVNSIWVNFRRSPLVPCRQGDRL